jgi:hypothetical protein
MGARFHHKLCKDKAVRNITVIVGVHSHLVATLELAAIVRQQVLEHDFPTPTQQSASQKKHNLCGLAPPEDTRRFEP